jgi:hypothetical protein
VKERKFRDIPRVDGPSEKITEGVRAMMERDAEAEAEAEAEGKGEEDEWVVV